MFCKSHLLILVLTWRSAVSAVQLGLDEVRDISVCSAEVDTCEGRITSLDTYEYVSELMRRNKLNSVLNAMKVSDL